MYIKCWYLHCRIDNMASAADHARDIAYALKRRRNTQTSNDAALLENIALSDDSGHNDERLNPVREAELESGDDPRRDALNGDFTTPRSISRNDTDAFRRTKCAVCGRIFSEASNFDGACVFHKPEATRLNDGTGVAVWSCCKSIETAKGCQKARHTVAAS